MCHYYYGPQYVSLEETKLKDQNLIIVNDAFPTELVGSIACKFQRKSNELGQLWQRYPVLLVLAVGWYWWCWWYIFKSQSKLLVQQKAGINHQLRLGWWRRRWLGTPCVGPSCNTTTTASIE